MSAIENINTKLNVWLNLYEINLKCRTTLLGLQLKLLCSEGHKSQKSNWCNQLEMANEESLKSPTILPWDRFHHWVHCVCVVTFDLELGQAMETVYPGHVKLTEKEKTNICYLSFPDSNSGCMGDTQFHFRIRQCPGRRVIYPSYSSYNHECPTALQTDSGYFYGYVYFRQIKDRTIRRGYFQKSVVLISKLPFVSMFNYIVSLMAPQFFENGMPSLEAICHSVDQWSSPVPGETLNLPFVGSLVQVRIPCRSDKVVGVPAQIKNHEPELLPANLILPSIHEVDMFSAFQPVLVHVQLLWELVLTGEPLVVMTSSPTLSANAVQALINMIWPLKYCSDYRPYFTIHDSEFREYTTKTQAPPGVILGVTNPFFVKTLQHWPHVVRIGEMQEATLSRALGRLKKGRTMKALECSPGVYTRYKPFLSKDKTILKKLLKGVTSKRPLEVQNALLKRYLLELTQSFMIPLERYIGSLMPLQRNISPHKGVPHLKPFEPEEFIKTLEHSGPQLTSGLKGDWASLYRKFFVTANFQGWFRYRQQEVHQKLEALHTEAICQADLLTWMQDKQEVEVVDLVLRLREKLVCIQKNEVPLSQDVTVKLRNSLESVINALPSDLQSVLL